MNEKKYLIKLSTSRAGLNSLDGWCFFGENYRATKGIPLSCYDTKKEALVAIAKEKKQLVKEKKQFKEDIRILRKSGMLRRYDGLDDFIRARTSVFAIKRLPVFEIIPVDAKKWESFVSPST